MDFTAKAGSVYWRNSAVMVLRIVLTEATSSIAPVMSIMNTHPTCTKVLSHITAKISECVLDKGFYACSDGATCIPVDQLCNNQTECLNGDDEGPMCCELLLKYQVVFIMFSIFSE
jgi:hypothetical protein